MTNAELKQYRKDCGKDRIICFNCRVILKDNFVTLSFTKIINRLPHDALLNSLCIDIYIECWQNKIASAYYSEIED